MPTLSNIFKYCHSQAIRLSNALKKQHDVHSHDNRDVQKETAPSTNSDRFIKNTILDFYKNGGKYTESEIDYGESRGSELW